MSKATLYISGPMSGKPDFNRTEFENAEWELKQLGDFNIINPHELPPPLTIPVDDADEVNWVLYLARDLRAIIHYSEDAILVTLPGAGDSRGASLEIRAAKALGIPVLSLEDFKKIYTKINQKD